MHDLITLVQAAKAHMASQNLPDDGPERQAPIAVNQQAIAEVVNPAQAELPTQVTQPTQEVLQILNCKYICITIAL